MGFEICGNYIEVDESQYFFPPTLKPDVTFMGVPF